MSYIEKSKQNKLNAEKAAAFDNMQKQRREEEVYTLGNKDAYSAMERELMRKAEQRRMDQAMADAYAREAYQEPKTAQDWGKLEGLAGTVRNAGNAVSDWWTGTMDRVNKVDPLTNERRK